MSLLIDWLEAHPSTAATAVVVVPLLFPQVWRQLGRVSRWLRRDTIEFRESMVSKMAEISATVAAVNHQVQVNGGGSIKDGVKRIEDRQIEMGKVQIRAESYRQHEFWTRPRAGLEMDATGRVQLASEAACRLFHVSDPDDLTNHSWLRFLDSHHVDSFIRTFRETAESGSIFRFSINIRSDNGEDRGEWEFKATPIDRAEPKLYSGYFAPISTTAKEIAGRAGWGK